MKNNLTHFFIKVSALFVVLFSAGLILLAQPIFAQTTKAFTTAELLKFDGKNGNKAYYAYEGKVYDVTGSRLWKEGQHFGLEAGQDLTGKMGEAPHGTDVFAGFEIVGTYGVAAVAAPATTTATPAVAANVEKVAEPAPWYQGRIRISGISILGWTGIFLGVFFVLNFATCFALPWSKLPLPWKGLRPGIDPLDQAPTHLKWSTVHKYFAWLTVIFGLVHGIIGLLQLLGVYV